MICAACGNNWTLQRAHIIRAQRTPEGCRELVKCPRCGYEQSVTRPDIQACEDD